jgi:peptidoglycan/LPS O-acetylase OafA/YrhL
MGFNVLQKEMSNSGRVYGLDAVRALAACLVVYEHGNFILEKASPTLASINIIDGVDLFFVLSGFLIGGILLRGLNETERIDFSFVKKFLVRRWFRTLPNYFLFLLINIFLIYIGISGGFLNKYLSTYFVFFQNFIKPYDFLFWESWSLSVEEWFYLLFPILLLTATVIFRNNKKILFLSCSLAFIIFSTIIRFSKAAHSTYNYDQYDLWIRKLVICRFDSIGFGLLAAWIHFYYNNTWIRYQLICFMTGLMLLVYCVLHGFETDPYFSETISFTLSGLGAMLILPMAEQLKTATSSLGKYVTFISIISYAIYLSHFGVSAALIKNLLHYELHPVFCYLLYWGSTIAFSAFIYSYYEKPLTNLRERFS